jgi:hypothetical protein
MQLCEGNDNGDGNDLLLGAARREASAARDDLWMTVVVLVGWSGTVAFVLSRLGGGL